MVHPNVPFFRSVGLMIGAIVGVGVFGLPFAFAQSGVVIGLLELFLLGACLTILQLMFGEVVTQTPGRRRLVSYIEVYLGQRSKWLALIAMACAVWGAMLAYMIVGGQFLSLMTGATGSSSMTFSYLIAILASALIFGGLRFASRVEVCVVVALLFLFFFVILASVPYVDPQLIFTLSPSKWFVPYGVLLFALSGFGIVPEMKDVLGSKHKRDLARAIVMAMSVIVLLYALFGISVVGVTGILTTPTAFEGLVPVLGGTFGLLAPLLGALTVLSIYMVLGVELLNIFKFDFRLSHRQAWLLVSIVPILLFAVGLREFIGIIGFVGSIFGGLLAILVALCYQVMRKRGLCKEPRCINFPAPLTWTLVGIFGLGILLEIIQTFF
ncbi:MAG: aromatic amino acid transport family protein [Patescibacteria group bacterium]